MQQNGNNLNVNDAVAQSGALVIIDPVACIVASTDSAEMRFARSAIAWWEIVATRKWKAHAEDSNIMAHSHTTKKPSP